MSCPARREGDELVCSTCGLRWEASGERPECVSPARRQSRPAKAEGRAAIRQALGVLAASPGAKWRDRR